MCIFIDNLLGLANVYNVRYDYMRYNMMTREIYKSTTWQYIQTQRNYAVFPLCSNHSAQRTFHLLHTLCKYSIYQQMCRNKTCKSIWHIHFWMAHLKHKYVQQICANRWPKHRARNTQPIVTVSERDYPV